MSTGPLVVSMMVLFAQVARVKAEEEARVKAEARVQAEGEARGEAEAAKADAAVARGKAAAGARAKASEQVGWVGVEEALQGRVEVAGVGQVREAWVRVLAAARSMQGRLPPTILVVDVVPLAPINAGAASAAPALRPRLARHLPAPAPSQLPLRSRRPGADRRRPRDVRRAPVRRERRRAMRDPDLRILAEDAIYRRGLRTHGQDCPPLARVCERGRPAKQRVKWRHLQPYQVGDDFEDVGPPPAAFFASKHK